MGQRAAIHKRDGSFGITNDANRYAVETVGDARYPFDLLCRVITVSLKTVKIVKDLPKLLI
jgi:predicted helicase